MTEMELRREIGKTFIDVMNGAEDCNWPYTARNIFLEQLDIKVEQATLKYSAKIAKITVQDYVEEEKFMDEFVARIQRKQLN